TDLTSPALNLHLARDAMGNIVALGNGPGANPATETYRYDPLYRLTGMTDAGIVLESYTYNRTGDRLSKTAAGLATGAYLYTAGTHQLASIGNAARANDADGNTTASVIGGSTYGFGYNGRNRLTLVQQNGQTVATYTYNALGERIGKATGAGTASYAYDEAGRLIGDDETSGTTSPKGKGKHHDKHKHHHKHHHPGTATLNDRDYVWLGDLPVAVIDTTVSGGVTTSTVDYVTADQLGTPRAVTDGTGTVIWQWAYQGDPFGEQQPTSSTGYVLNLRYPGQYYDAESNTNYNLFRTYEAATGRYLQPDPIGLDGGISAYAYVGGDPLSYTDPLGLSGFGFNAGGSAQAGLIRGGAIQANSGVGLFWGNGLNAGGYTASGSFAGRGNFDYHSPGEQGDSTYTPNNGYSTLAIGASAGFGGGVFYTNADSAEQLLGAFDTSTLNVGFITIQWAEDASGTYTASLGFAKGLGFDFNRYQVTTTSAGTFYRRRTSTCN
ncbi:MAG: RHS repeat-associated core domain-containing protein, partial [Rhodanobacter sp.]